MRNALALLLVLAPSALAQPTPAKTPNPYTERLAAVRKQLAPLLRAAPAEAEKIVADWVALAKIPSPSGKEDARAKQLMTWFRGAGLEVSRDPAGNVVGRLKGSGGHAKHIVVFAHMDNVFGPEVPIQVEREGNILRGPGVGDDVSGLVALVWTARLIQRFGLRFAHDIVFVGTVQEELGLKGARAYFDRVGDQVSMAISVDGGFGGVSYGALGIHWYELRFKGPGWHTLSSMGKPAPARAVGEAIAGIYALRVPRQPASKRTWYNVGRIGAGAVVNAQPKEAWLTVDLRSMDGDELTRLEQRVFAIARAAAKQAEVELAITPIQKFPAAQLPDGREGKLVRAAEAAIGSITGKEVWLSASGASDHCVAIARGVPGIGIGCGEWRGAHTTEEWVDTTTAPQSIQQLALILSLVGELEPAPENDATPEKD